MRVLLTGATGAIGKRLVPQLIERGHQVTATTRSPAKLSLLRDLGAESVILDGLDGVAVGEVVARAEPEAIIHEMTALAGPLDMRHFDRWFGTTNELRTKGTEHLLAAASATGVKRFVAQSFTGWTNARVGGPVKTESDPLDSSPAAAQGQSMASIRYLEEAVPAASLDGIALRYGSLYGPGSSDATIELVRKRMWPIIGNGAGVWSWLHVDDAASATVAALERGKPGIYNIVDDDPAAASEWLPYLAEVLGAKAPMRLPVWLGRLMAGEVVVRLMTEARGASNGKARRELDWQPAWSSWRDGFRDGLTAAAPTSVASRKTVAA